MYAILKHGGHQYRVASGDRIVVDRLSAEVGEVVGLSPVLLVADGDRFETDGAGLDGVRIAATVISHPRGRKLRVFTYKPKKRHRRTLGFRAELTELLVEGVLSAGEPLPEPSGTPVAAAEPASPAPPKHAGAAPPAPARPRRRAATAEVVEDESVAAAWGEEKPDLSPEGSAAQAEVPAEEAEQPGPGPEASGASTSGTASPPEGVIGEEAPARRRRPRAAAAREAPSEERSATPAEETPQGGTRRRRVTRREEPGTDGVE